MAGLEEKKASIVLALDAAKSGAPVGYICERCGIEETCENPCKYLKQLEEDGIIQRLPPSSWSASLEPRYELSKRAKKLLQQLITTRLEQLIQVRV